MPAGAAVYAGKAVVEVTAGEELLDDIVPMVLPGTMGFFETFAVAGLQCIEVLHDKAIEGTCSWIALSVDPLDSLHGGGLRGKDRTEPRDVSGSVS